MKFKKRFYFYIMHIFIVILFISACNQENYDYKLIAALNAHAYSPSFSAESVSSTQIDLSWTMVTNNPNIVQYKIYRNNVQINETPSFWFSDTGLSPETAYTYAIHACDAQGRVLYTYSNQTAETCAVGNTFYIDPGIGNINNNGSYNAPWKTLQEVIEYNLIETREYAVKPYTRGNKMVVKNPGAPVKAGDTLILRSGIHGEFNFQSAFNEKYITVKAQPGHTPTLSRILLSAASKWRIQGVTVRPPQFVKHDLVRIENHSWNGPATDIIVENCTLYSIQNSSSWSDIDWNNLSCNAINVFGNNIRIINNTCTNVNFGITITGYRCMAKNNSVINFAGDGLRGNGKDLEFEYNTVKNCYAVNANHDDGFQSFYAGGTPVPERIVLRGNRIINFEDENQPYRGNLQGIGCFDGPYIDWIIENNLVVVNHWHGISMYTAMNCRIVNNTVVDRLLNDQPNNPNPWIMIVSPSKNCVIRNNISFQIISASGVTVDHNYTINDDTIFIDPLNFNFHLNSSAINVINTGSPLYAPVIDIEGNIRSGYDLGAYDY